MQTRKGRSTRGRGGTISSTWIQLATPTWIDRATGSTSARTPSPTTNTPAQPRPVPGVQYGGAGAVAGDAQEYRLPLGRRRPQQRAEPAGHPPAAIARQLDRRRPLHYPIERRATRQMPFVD